MDDQRDYAEERANLLLMHEECIGCNVCQRDEEDDADKAYEAFLKDSNHVIGVEIDTEWDECDLLDKLHELLGPCVWGVKYQ